MSDSGRTLWKLEFTAPPALRDTLTDDLESLTGGGTCIPAFGVWRNPASGALFEEPMDYWVTTTRLESVARETIEKVKSRLLAHREITSWHCLTRSEGGISILVS